MSRTRTIDPLGTEDRPDGHRPVRARSRGPTKAVTKRDDAKPVVFVTTDDPTALIDAAGELAAIDEVLGDNEALSDDWVARRELLERRVEARSTLEHEFERRVRGALDVAAMAHPEAGRPGLRWTELDTVSATPG